MSHLLSFLILLVKMQGSKSAAGISLKTQQLYALVFVCRYLDLFWNFISVYNSVMKVLFIMLSLSTVFMVKYGDPQSKTYDAESDSFPHLYLIIPCLILGVLVNQDHTSPTEVSRTAAARSPAKCKPRA